MSLPLDQLPDEVRKQVELVLFENNRLQVQIRLLKEQLRLAYLEKYGPRSEKLNENQLKLLDLEPGVVAAEIEKEAALPEDQKQTGSTELASPLPRQSNQNHPGRVQLPKHLERREVIVPCPPDQIYCKSCNQERPVIGYEITEELDVVPAVYYVRVIKREKRGTPCHSEEGVATAPTPAKIIPKSKLSNEMIVDVLVKKYEEHLPIYRQCAILERRAGIQLSRQTLVDAIMAAAGYLEPVVGMLHKQLLAGSYIQADETPIGCQSERVKGRNYKSFIWEYSRPAGPVVFDFQMSRGRDGPKEFLKGFKGKLQTDAYGAYDKLGEGIVYVGCWAHVRRPFFKATELMPEDPRPKEVLSLIRELYQVEERARKEQMTAQARLKIRQEVSRPIVENLKKQLAQIRQEVLPQSILGKGCNYALGQWNRLEEFLKDGELEIDNNWCENAIRPLKLGAKNWLHIGSEQAGPKIAAIASIFETCRRLGVNIREYLQDILPKLPEWPMKRVEELTPEAWKSGQVR